MIILYVENPNAFTKKTVNLINKFGKDPRHKVNSVVFLYTNKLS